MKYTITIYSSLFLIFNIIFWLTNINYYLMMISNISMSLYFITITLMKISEYIINFKLNITIDNNIYKENDKDVKMN